MDLKTNDGIRYKKILVCGGRNAHPAKAYYHVREKLNYLTNHISEYYEDGNWLPADIWIITGGADGYDRAAYDWGVVNWCMVTEHPANWKEHGRAAGPIRNQYMLDTHDIELVVAFPGGRGTADMVRRARKAGVPVWEVE